jgi:hypothetical protein
MKSQNASTMESQMNTFTLRKIPLPVERRLRQLARESHRSLNKTTIELLTKAVGIGPVEKKFARKHRDVKSALRPWSDSEYKEFERNTKIFEAIDKEMWEA